MRLRAVLPVLLLAFALGEATAQSNEERPVADREIAQAQQRLDSLAVVIREMIGIGRCVAQDRHNL